jgi:GNAT superfamily N-acetyltransferase
VNATSELELWEKIIRADEANLAYYAERTDLPGAVLFCCECAADPEFDVALVYCVTPDTANATLQAIVGHFRERGRRPRIRLSPLSAPVDWPERLNRAGFVETSVNLAYFVIPETVRPIANPDVRVERAVSPADAEQFAAVQVAGFNLPPDRLRWERDLARGQLTANRHGLYLASLAGRTVGAARSIRDVHGATGLAALATLPEARGHGVGTALLARMIDDARVAGSHTIFGTLVPGSYAAAMYARLGFVTLFTTRTFVQCP